MGFKIIVYAGICILPEYMAVTRALRTLKTTGFVETYDPKPSAHDLFNVCGMQELMAFDKEVSQTSQLPRK